MGTSGGQYERDICRRLTKWWMGPKYDGDVIFWRTSQSGGRATTRKKKGKKTATAHCGDITATDPKGFPLTGLITFELKYGYKPFDHIHAVLDHDGGEGKPKYHSWFIQAHNAAKLAGTPHWAIVHHRKGREDTMVMTHSLWRALNCSVNLISPPVMQITITDPVGKGFMDLVACQWESFLEGVTPNEIRRLYNIHKGVVAHGGL